MASSDSLILASGSTYKRQLLDRLGLTFDVERAEIDEVRHPDESPRELAQRLAAEKAQRVADRREEAWVLGADQTVALEGTHFSKPGSKPEARAQLRTLRGRTHHLTTAITLIDPTDEAFQDVVTFEMEMRELTERDIRAYVDEDEPLACAGSYRIEAAGIRLFRATRGDDYTAIIGLPLTRVWNALEESHYFEARSSDETSDA